MQDNLTLAVTLKAIDQMSTVVGGALNTVAQNSLKLGHDLGTATADMTRLGEAGKVNATVMDTAIGETTMAVQQLDRHLSQVRLSLERTEGLDAGFIETQLAAGDLGGELSNVAKKSDDAGSKLKKGAAEGESSYKKLTSSLKDVSDHLQRLGTYATISGAAIGYAAFKPIQAYADLEDAVTRAKVAFQTSTGLDAGFAEVQRTAVRLGDQLPGTTADFTQMAAALKESGISTQTILKGGLQATAYLRVLMGNLAPEQAAQLMASFSHSLGIAGKDYVKFVDLVQRQKFAFGVDPQEFSYTLEYVGPILKQLGVGGLEGTKSVIGLTGALAQAGIKGSQLGTSLRRVMDALPNLDHVIAKHKQLAPLLEKYHVSLKFFEHGKFLGMQNLVEQVSKLNAMTAQDKLIVLNQLFGAEGATAMAQVASNGLKGYQEAQRTLGRQASLQTRLNMVMGTLRNLWEAFTGTATNLLADFGASVAPELKTLVVWLNNVTTALDDWTEAHPRLTHALMIGAMALSAFLIVGGSALLLIGTLGKTILFVAEGFEAFATLGEAASVILEGGIAAAFPEATAAATAFFAATLPLTWPIVAVGAALALVAAVVWKYWKPISGFFSGFFKGLMEGLRPLAPVGKVALGALGIYFAPVIFLAKTLWGWLTQLLKPVDDVGGHSEKMGERFGKAVAGAIAWVAQLFGKLSGVANLIGQIGKLWPFGQAMAAVAPVAMPAAAMPGGGSFPRFPGAIAGPAAPLRGGLHRGGDTHITYAPVVNPPPGTPEDQREWFRQELHRQKDEVRKVVDSSKSARGRTEYK